MTLETRRKRRSGFVLPALGIFLIALFAFVALAVDIGMLAVARTQCQNAADVAALAGCRTLNNKSGAVDNNRANALVTCSTSVTSNKLLNTAFTSAQVTSTTAGVYLYNSSTQTFAVSYPGSPGNGQSWTAMNVAINVAQPTYFAKVLGFTTMPTGATATAVFRPRDVAFVLDMTGSMAFASEFNGNATTGIVGSLDPNNLIPAFGHYSDATISGKLRGSVAQTDGSGEAISLNNCTITTAAGPPIIRNFCFDPANIGTPTTTALPVTLITNGSGQQVPQGNAFHNSNVVETAGDPTAIPPVPQTYDFTSYNPLAYTATEGPTPAPDTYGQQIDAGTQVYMGDRWRRLDGKIYKTVTAWTGTTRAAGCDTELLGYTVSGTTIKTSGGTAITTSDKFSDPVWEGSGYDLDIGKYRLDRGTGTPLTPTSIAGGTYTPVLLPAADRFKGYSMGPGYYGKTFYIWPPDPRPANDWRKKFFQDSTGTAFVPTANIDSVILNTSGGSQTLKNGGFTVNYTAVLAWLKQAGTPQVLPPNLRAGRVLYYSSIPDTVLPLSGTAQQQLDQVFWKKYIDYVVANGFTNSDYLYGPGDSWASTPSSVNAAALNTWTGPGGTWPPTTPYLCYTDSPSRPRLHFWFGPLTMLDFIGTGGGNLGSNWNWKPGTCYEAQCWQLKAAMNSVIAAVQANHPNDNLGMSMFSYQNYSSIKVPMGQDYATLQNALFYPNINNMLALIKAGDTTTEYRPYNTSFTGYTNNAIPNANGGTDPNTGMAMAFNLLSPSANLPAVYGSIKGRKGASKLVIFETDGVPNSYRALTLNKAGYDTYYTIGGGAGSPGNGDPTVMAQAITVVQQMAKQMATTNGGSTDSGLSLPNAPCKVYAIAFGDLFDTTLAPSATFRPTALQFLANVEINGGTAPVGATTIDPSQIITGQYQTRITNLQACLQRIFQSGVTVSLIQ